MGTARSSNSTALLAIAGVYLLTNVLLGVATVPGANLREAADGHTWFDPAVALLRYGALVDLHDPSKAQTYRGPLFPAFAAGVMWVSGGESPRAIVAGQVLLLLLTGLIVRRIAAAWVPRHHNLAFGLAIFNPNALAAAHLVQSDTLFAFLATGTLYATLSYARRPRHTLGLAIAVGALLGLSCLVRPTAQFLILVLPILFPFLASPKGVGWKRHALFGAASSLVACALLLPWALYLSHNGQGITLVAPAARHRFVWDQLRMLDSEGASYWEPSHLEAPGGAVEQYVQARGPYWHGLSEPERLEELVSLGYREMLRHPLVGHLRTGARSLVRFLFGSGSANLRNLLGTDIPDRTRSWLFKADLSHPVSVFSDFLRAATPLAIAISLSSVAFVLVLRGGGLLGIVSLALNRQWTSLFMHVGMIAYFALVHVYVGNSRYRLCVEPALILLAVSGYSAALATIPQWRRRMAGDPSVAGTPVPE